MRSTAMLPAMASSTARTATGNARPRPTSVLSAR